MDKILWATNAARPNWTSLEFAGYLAKLTNSGLTAVFLENLVADQKASWRPSYGVPFEWEIDETSDSYVQKRSTIEMNIGLFKAYCEKEFVRFVIHRDEGVPVADLITESRYADVVVLDPGMSFNDDIDDKPSQFAKRILKDAECPVILSPAQFDGIDELLFACDGTKSSILAIKQFSYLFPEFEDRKVIVFQVNDSGKWEEADRHYLREWLQNRYSAVGFEACSGDPSDMLFSHISDKRNCFVVMGAYGRTALSKILKPSNADLIIRYTSNPVFISHD